MGQPETAVGRDAAVGTLPSTFVSIMPIPETLHTSTVTVGSATGNPCCGYGSATASWATTPAPECASEMVFLTELVCEGRTFVFNHPLPVRVVQEDDGCSFESEEYSLTGHGDTRLEAESSFRHVFLYVWDRIACEDDEKLTLDAIELKRALLALAKKQ